MSSSSNVDHLVFAGADLEAGIEMFHERLGVRPVMGGRHPGWGTWNAILALGDRCYLELIAPDPTSDLPAHLRPEIFSGEESFRLKGWLAAVQGPERLRRRLLAGGFDPGRILEGSRELPGGDRLEWTLSDPMVRAMDGVVPLMIDWGHSRHPAASAPSGCGLVSLSLEHPESACANVILEMMDLPALVMQGPRPLMKAILATPCGEVVLGCETT